MRKWLSSFTLIEMLVVIAIIAILAGLLLPALSRAREESRRKACASNLKQVVTACTTYQEPNGDFFPAFMQDCLGNVGAGGDQTSGNPYIPASISASKASPPINAYGILQGSNGSFQPMPSLASLYPSYVDNVNVFRCPSTSDKPLIASASFFGAKHTCFGYAIDPMETGPQGTINYTMLPTNTVYNWTDPAWYSGAEVTGPNKCSYLYDELTNFQQIGPGQAMASDADGFTWTTANGQRPTYTSGSANANLMFGWNANGKTASPFDGVSMWGRYPRQSNHNGGQNVMYFDGHVKWVDTVYASRDPADNMYCPQKGWGPDTDSYLWDGGSMELCTGR